MIPIDPIDLSNPAPFDAVSYYLHIIIGIVGLCAALIALSAKKGSRPHIFAGRVFVGCIGVIAVTSLIMLTARPTPPLLSAALTSVYAVATAILALRPGTKNVRRMEIGLFVFQLGMNQ